MVEACISQSLCVRAHRNGSEGEGSVDNEPRLSGFNPVIATRKAMSFHHLDEESPPAREPNKSNSSLAARNPRDDWCPRGREQNKYHGKIS
uniref:Uncharacterized protein n=1 Tax=Physcomitrium patens TaxID=3218 RepID=A0A2K1J4G6_PHYPA|nr:hypothetical protein PHYPA_022267 [Physcomitrium patens]